MLFFGDKSSFLLTEHRRTWYQTNVEHFLAPSQTNSRHSPDAGLAMFDVRSVANFVLDEADKCGVEVTNMALNKLVYFMHCDFLLERKSPLVGAKIEAWKHGPVFREVYHEFKRWGDEPIRGRANRVDPHSGEVIRAKLELDGSDADFLGDLVKRYIVFTASQLRAFSHREGGPWAKVWGHDGNANVGMKIGNELIVEFYEPEVRQ
jgi:uncharacterized phage-associated protein